jgi:hypothetical protein
VCRPTTRLSATPPFLPFQPIPCTYRCIRP